MSYHYPYNDPATHSSAMTPTTPGASSNASTPMAHPWEYEVAASTVPHDDPNLNASTSSTPSLNLTLQPAEFSPQELYQHQLPQVQEQPPAHATSEPPTVIQLEERIPLVPSQYRGRSARKSGERSRVHAIDTAAASASGGDADRRASASPATGPVRAHGSSVRAHPYKRPHSAEDIARAQSAAAAARQASDQSFVRFVQQGFSDETSAGASAGTPQAGMGGSPSGSGLSRMRYASPPPLLDTALSSSSSFPFLLMCMGALVY
ncbi:hypothetical protein FA95DRAFT_285361 [Auriscalpium vulgare]|uniref:Uncharacterized protein n=1 Tax=Auriscalpium vulgare TaxID=40419 RepID=A0ACB8RK86_9AGAM|nr:hypothetical protein FA95DRAFT_285361 [Auriscalpium vulgare]